MRVFKEKQRFNQLWLIILLLISALVPIGIILGAYMKDTSRFSTGELVLLISIILLVSSLILLCKLTLKIDEHGIYYKFFPFHLSFKIITWNAIDKAYVRRYDAVTEYGGWGLKAGSPWVKSKGKAINISGDIGIQLELKNGKKLLIGTQKQEEAKRILNTYKAKIKN